VTLQSGRPFTVALLPENDNSNTGMASLGFGANNRPNRFPPASCDPARRLVQIPRFVIADYGSFGNSGRKSWMAGYCDFSTS